MKARTILCSMVIASMGVGSFAFAQPHGDRGHGRDDRQESRGDRNDGRGDHRDSRDWGHSRRQEAHDRRDERQERREERRFYNARSSEFHRGGRLPGELRNRQYVVNDWRGHRLSAPPRGYQWVQVGPDYVLASIAGGIIANLILSH